MLIIYDVSHNKAINWARLREQARQQFGDNLMDLNEVAGPIIRFLFREGAVVNLPDADALVQAHDATQRTDTQLAATQYLDAEASLAGMWNTALRSLPIADSVIILWARRLAQIRGDDPAAITTKAQAATYWDGEMNGAGTEAGRLRVQRDSFQALLELVSRALID